MESEETLEVIYKKFKNQYSYDVPKKLSTLIELYEDLIEECKEGYLFTIKLFKKSVGGEMSKIFFKTTSIYELDDELFLLEILFTTAYSRPIIGSETRW
jgi:predicted transcriptional regulator